MNTPSMNSGTSSTELNDMLTNFVSYVDSFYGINDPLYPMMNVETKQPLTKFDIYRATEYYLAQCSDERVTNCTWGMAILLIVRESETFYLKSTTTNLWGSNGLHTKRNRTSYIDFKHQ